MISARGTLSLACILHGGGMIVDTLVVAPLITPLAESVACVRGVPPLIPHSVIYQTKAFMVSRVRESTKRCLTLWEGTHPVHMVLHPQRLFPSTPLDSRHCIVVCPRRQAHPSHYRSSPSYTQQRCSSTTGCSLSVYLKIRRGRHECCLLYTSPSPRDQRGSRMPSSA